MSVTVFGHQHDAALTLDGVGTPASQLIIQTGTIIFHFQGVPGEDWVRDRLRHPVLDLTAVGTGALVSVRAVASASPASMSYAPAAPAVTSQQGSFARGNVVLFGYADQSGQVNVGGPVNLPVVGGASQFPASSMGGGWAVDRTRANRVQNHVELIVDLAVAGPSSLLRLAYSLFVTVSFRLIADVEIPHREP
jgi:hypothetical protein